MALQLGVSLSSSFIEFCLTQTNENEKILSFQRKYLAKESLTQAVQSFLQEESNRKIKRVIISTRFLEKILESHLGGGVAQVVTSGFESWPVLRQPTRPFYFEIHPYRADPLGVHDLIFPLSERVSAQGQILVPLDLAELEFIAAKLKLMKVKKVCINLLFSDKNPVHLESVKNFFQEKGFLVYAEMDLETTDEMAQWRRNLLNACLTGSFTDFKEELYAAFAPHFKPEEIYFAFEKEVHNEINENKLISLFFGLPYSFSKIFQKTPQVLHLGIEDWCLYDFSRKQNIWESQWGPIGVKTFENKRLNVQLTEEIIAVPLGGLNHSKTELGYEPGPILFGKAHRPTVFDVLFAKQNPKNMEAFIHRQVQNRLDSQLNVLVRNKYEGFSSEEALHDLKDQIIHQIIHQVELNVRHKQIVMTGALAPFLFEKIKKRSTELDWILHSNADEVEAWAASTLKGRS